jgi:hypothetical protein
MHQYGTGKGKDCRLQQARMKARGRGQADGEGRREQGQAGANEQGSMDARGPDECGNRDRHDWTG